MTIEWLRGRHVGALLRLRSASGQHTATESEALRRFAAGSVCAVEIGVAEGVSAAAIRESMQPNGTLWLVDPYYTGRSRVSMARLVARRTLREAPGAANIRWIREESQAAARLWDGEPIDFLFIDGDHSYEACLGDWNCWSKFVRPGGVVLFHDSAVNSATPTQAGWGPVKVVDQLFRSPTGETAGWEYIAEADSISVVRRSEC